MILEALDIIVSFRRFTHLTFMGVPASFAMVFTPWTIHLLVKFYHNEIKVFTELAFFDTFEFIA